LGKPLRFVTDEGTEFDNRTVRQYANDAGIEMVFLRSYVNTAERVIGTLKGMLFPRVKVGGKPWTQYLPSVVSQYNRSVHSTTNMTPNAAHDEENNREVFEYVTRKRRFLKKVRQGRRPRLTEGDIVKIQVPHSTVRRINIAQYGPRPYRVEAVVSDASGLQRYRVAGRLFLRHELLKVKDVRRKTTDGLASIPPDSKEAGDLPGVGQIKAPDLASVMRIGNEPVAGISTYVMGDAVPPQPVQPGRRVRSKQRVLPANFMELYRDMLASRRTNTDVTARERAFYIMLARFVGERSVVYTHARQMALIEKALTQLGYGVRPATEEINALVDELIASEVDRLQGVPGGMPATEVTEPAPGVMPDASEDEGGEEGGGEEGGEEEEGEGDEEEEPEEDEGDEPPAPPPAARDVQHGNIRLAWQSLMQARGTGSEARIRSAQDYLYRLAYDRLGWKREYRQALESEGYVRLLRAFVDKLRRARYELPDDWRTRSYQSFSDLPDDLGDWVALVREGFEMSKPAAKRSQSAAEPASESGAASSAPQALPSPPQAPPQAPPQTSPQAPPPRRGQLSGSELAFRSQASNIERAYHEMRSILDMEPGSFERSYLAEAKIKAFYNRVHGITSRERFVFPETTEAKLAMLERAARRLYSEDFEGTALEDAYRVVVRMMRELRGRAG
jgi:hypothetical protein